MTILDEIADRVAVGEHDGRSGARIETARLADGTRVYVKTAPVATDLAGLLTGSATRELELLRDGVFDRLPPGVDTALLAVEVVGDDLVTVSRDLGSAVLSWDRVLTTAEVRLLFERISSVHRRFLGAAPDGLCPLTRRLTLLAPQNMGIAARANAELAAAVCTGWERFGGLVPDDVADVVTRLQADPAPLVAPMSTGGSTLLHGDLWLVNIALDGDVLIPLDWGVATLGPPSLDLVTFCVGGTSNVEMSREQLVAEARIACADMVDGAAFAAAELWALLELGWNKALDATEHPDPAKRAVERADLDFWVSRARASLDAGAIPGA